MTGVVTILKENYPNCVAKNIWAHGQTYELLKNLLFQNNTKGRVKNNEQLVDHLLT